jgi:hypothetical protein
VTRLVVLVLIILILLIGATPARAQTPRPAADIIDVLIDFLLKQKLQDLPASAPRLEGRRLHARSQSVRV